MHKTGQGQELHISMKYNACIQLLDDIWKVPISRCSDVGLVRVGMVQQDGVLNTSALEAAFAKAGREVEAELDRVKRHSGHKGDQSEGRSGAILRSMRRFPPEQSAPS